MNISEIIEASNLKKSLKTILFHGSVNMYHLDDSKSIYDKDIFVLIYIIPSKYSPLLKPHRLPTKFTIENQLYLLDIVISDILLTIETNNSARTTDFFFKHILNPKVSWGDSWKTYETTIYNELCKYIRIINEEEVKIYIKQMDYNDFLNTPYWKAIALNCKEEADYRCMICNSSQDLNVHHRSYQNLGLELWDTSDLIVLCNTCHFLYHDNNRK